MVDFYNIHTSYEVYPVDILSPIVNLVSLVSLEFKFIIYKSTFLSYYYLYTFFQIFCCVLVIFHRKYGQRSSGLLFIFWFLVVIFGSSKFLISPENLPDVSLENFSQLSYLY